MEEKGKMSSYSEGGGEAGGEGGWGVWKPRTGTRAGSPELEVYAQTGRPRESQTGPQTDVEICGSQG